MLTNFHNLHAFTDLSYRAGGTNLNRSSRVTMSLWPGCQSGLQGIFSKKSCENENWASLPLTWLKQPKAVGALTHVVHEWGSAAGHWLPMFVMVPTPEWYVGLVWLECLRSSLEQQWGFNFWMFSTTNSLIALAWSVLLTVQLREQPGLGPSRGKEFSAHWGAATGC